MGLSANADSPLPMIKSAITLAKKITQGMTKPKMVVSGIVKAKSVTKIKEVVKSA